MIVKVALPFGLETPEAKREPYREALRSVGIEYVESPQALDGLSGLVLTGGTDVDPIHYHQSPHPKTQPPDTERDERELALLRDALERDIPVLAICRGLQLFNVYFGGTLNQHIEGHRVPGEPNAHHVQICRGTELASILNAGEYHVNSRHHQCVDRVGEGLVVSATAPDGIVEGLELPKHRFALAVQWHPEDRIDGRDQKLFKAFAEAVHAVSATVPA